MTWTPKIGDEVIVFQPHPVRITSIGSYYGEPLYFTGPGCCGYHISALVPAKDQETAVRSVLDAAKRWSPDNLESVEGSHELQQALYKLLAAFGEPRS